MEFKKLANNTINFGINRIIEFERLSNPNKQFSEMKYVIIDVYNDKIKNLISDNYIRTDIGKKMAEPLLYEMKLFVNKLETIS